MKLITFVVPCYNSEAYMSKAIDSILPAGSDVEILIVNDGSTDGTHQVAQSYQEKYPEIVRVIDKENGGHGDAINVGLENASGIYFKVVDSDDWLDRDSLIAIMDFFEELQDDGEKIDMLISNYVYEKVGARHKKCIQYRNVLPQNKIFTWDEIGHFRLDQYILMHSVIYRTQMLKDSGIQLPKHMFYVDNIYVYYPLPYVEKIYYMDVNLYRYYIGREDQSVNEKVMISRVDQQIYVTKAMIDMYHMSSIKIKKLRDYMTNYLAIMMTISSILLIRSKEKKNLAKEKELWQYLKKSDEETYQKIRHGFLGRGVNLPGRPGRTLSSMGYRVARRFVGFN